MAHSRARVGATQPDVSVVIPTYRRERQLQVAIGSALNGGVDKVEVLVVDDSPEQSARATAEAVDDPRVHYFPMPAPSRGRPALVRNYALERARGRYLYCLDDDDACFPGALASLQEALDDQKSVSVAFGQVKATGPDRQTREGYDRWWSWAARIARQVSFSSWLTAGVILFRGTLIINSACMIRRTAAVALGGYDPEIEVYEDVDFFTRGIRRFGHVFVDRPVLLYGTGLPSIMHDLDWEKQVLSSAHQRIHAGYKRTWGDLDYRALQSLSKLLPIEAPPVRPETRDPRPEATPQGRKAPEGQQAPAA